MTIESCKNCNCSDEFCVSGDCPNDVDNDNDTQVEVITLNHSKNNRLTIKNAVEVITPMTNYDILKEYEAHKTPIPSYEEWRDLQDDLATCDKDSNNVCEQKEELYEENKQLKELLKECRTIIYENILGEYVIELCERITNATGEK